MNSPLRGVVTIASIFLFAASAVVACVRAPSTEGNGNEPSPDYSRSISQSYGTDAAANCANFAQYPAPPAKGTPAASCTTPNPPNPGCGDGAPCIPPSGWPGGYAYNDWNCHQAAGCGVLSGTCAGCCTGILSCTGVTNGFGGHTVNYTVSQLPLEMGAIICLSEPQNGGQADANKCCWTQTAAQGNTPLTAQGQPGYTCYQNKCTGQSRPEGGAALAPGTCWPTDNSADSCVRKNPGNLNNCYACCRDRTDEWDPAIAASCTQASYNDALNDRCWFYSNCAHACQDPCPQGQSHCGNGTYLADAGWANAPTCVDLATDTNNCGWCGHACGPGKACVNKMCRDVACGTPGQPCCDGGEAAPYCDVGKCSGGNCTACGGVDEPCCDWGCNPQLTCNGEGTCVSQPTEGVPGTPCCDDEGTAAPHCELGVCDTSTNMCIDEGADAGPPPEDAGGCSYSCHSATPAFRARYHDLRPFPALKKPW